MVHQYLNGKTKKVINREYDLTPSSLNKWIGQSQTTGSFKEKDNQTPEEIELNRLLSKENKKLLMENDILMQAALILGRKLM
jgi:transposase